MDHREMPSLGTTVHVVSNGVHQAAVVTASGAEGTRISRMVRVVFLNDKTTTESDWLREDQSAQADKTWHFMEASMGLRERLEKLFTDSGARPVCHQAIDQIITIFHESSVGSMTSEMQARGWEVTFPVFKSSRAFVVYARKGDKKFSAIWTHDHNLPDAIEKLSRETCHADEEAHKQPPATDPLGPEPVNIKEQLRLTADGISEALLSLQATIPLGNAQTQNMKDALSDIGSHVAKLFYWLDADLQRKESPQA